MTSETTGRDSADETMKVGATVHVQINSKACLWRQNRDAEIKKTLNYDTFSGFEGKLMN